MRPSIVHSEGMSLASKSTFRSSLLPEMRTKNGWAGAQPFGSENEEIRGVRMSIVLKENAELKKDMNKQNINNDLIIS